MSYNTGSNFNTQHWYETKIDRRTREAILNKMTETAQAHENDSDAALLDMIRQRAGELGYVPYAVDCLAGPLITQRFGSWLTAVKLAKLPMPRGPGKIRESQLYQEEYKLQQKLHRREKEQKLEKRKTAEQERQKRKEDRSQPPE